MKATGIVRRIDDLGRVVIPKEIRRTMRIREGDPLEIFTEKDGEVIFKKYSPMGEWSETAAQLCEAMNKISERFVAICDRDSYIAVSGVSKRELHEKHVSGDIEQTMDGRRFY
ncbi:MAG: AbrB/MazE/SpoVT family DNA-binding domain-containing protein, partial [Oscillospiraceae bacterium]|nr:AbrB/MazE/SpoVT family DNA-binding domain-containing protein [Oscillospiraceae bacterium]